MEISEIFPQNGHRQNLFCNQCENSLVLVYDKFEETLSGIKVTVEGLPYLFCKVCNEKYLPEHSRFCIIDLHRRAFQQGSKFIRSERNKPNENFGFTEVPFLYDSDDYYYLPGLERQWDIGFLTPVFFNKAVLLKFQNHSDYRVRFASKTYGTVYKGEDFDISFGINKSEKVIMWLGDIAKLPTTEQYYLLSENVESDHDIGSEFYDGQIEARFTDRTPEDELIRARSDFLEFCYKEFNVEVSHLKEETLQSISNLNPPVLHTLKEQKDIIDLLYKINIESLNTNKLSKLLTSLGGDPADIGSLKKLEAIAKIKFSERDIPSIISPLFVLYDLRVLLLHEIGRTKTEEELKFICERLGIPVGSTFETIYPELVKQLTNCYKGLI